MKQNSNSNVDNYKETCVIEKTVWRSTRTNPKGDELVVAAGKYKNRTGYFMAWETTENRPECISWNGKTSWYPRMFWLYVKPQKSLLVQTELEVLDERVPGEKSYWHKTKDLIEKDGEYYVKLKLYKENEHGVPIYKPSTVTDRPDSLSQAISYVQWFNENHRQLSQHKRLLSQKKKAKSRRRKRLNKRLLSKIHVDRESYRSI